ANLNVGGQTVSLGAQAAVVRGVGLIQSIDQIRETMVSANGGAPVQVRDIAKVTVGYQPRLGIAGQDDADDIVQGIVLMRRGAQSKPTIERVEALIDKINTTGILPPGVRVEKIYDRADLIAVTTRTVLHSTVEGIALIFVLQLLFLGNLRSALIVAATIPFALAFAIGILVLRGESANLLSIGAIDFGLVVDATVIMMENIYRRLSQRPEERFARSAALDRAGSIKSLRGRYAIILLAATEVSQGIAFAAAIIITAFLPLFTLGGIEGHIFGPMAKTYAYAIAGGLIATFTVTPALSALLLQGSVREKHTLGVRLLHRIYDPAVGSALANRTLVAGVLVLLLAVSAAAVLRLGLEFLPKLEEGNFWIRATMPPSISLEAGNAYVNRMRDVIKRHPEVITVVSQHGRPDDGTDATGFFNAEFFVPLRPASDWPDGPDKEKLTERINADLEQAFPGVEFNFSQAIEDNVEEAASGVKGENSVKLFGGDLDTLERTAGKIKDVMAGIPGITDLSVFDSQGQPTVRIDVDRARAARLGLAPNDVNTTVQAAIGGQAAGNLYEEGSDRNFPIIVRLAPQYRTSLDAIGRIPVGAPSPSGNGIVPVPLADVADVRLVSGASFIYREDQERYIPIKFSVRGRDLGGAVQEAQRRVAEQVLLPGGYHLEWVGEFGNLEEALGRLRVAVPLSLVLICLLLYVKFGSVADMLLSASAIPMALVGGILSLYLTGTTFSVSAAIGFVALFGISAMNGIIFVAYYNQMIDSGLNRTEAILRTCAVQMRPVVMTCTVACVGLLPAAFSTGIGSQVQRPLALVVVGGSLLTPVLILLAVPVLVDAFSRRRPSPEPYGVGAEPAE
ncbi:MAG: efflux RND transporter permease subunit, partial [Acetobacteraceae bacterium]|nr:efflux RND transporter permease subunit [Acetobacteraceae bacterium]